MSTNGQSGNNAIRFEFNWQNKNKLGVYVGNGSTYSGASFGDDNSMSAGNWYLITFTWDKTEGASGTARAYKDGVLESTHTTINDFLPNNLNNVVLGGGFSGAGERYYNGLMNGLAIHSRALSDEDITYMYNAGAGRSQFTDVAGAQAGTHTVTYTATDAASNEATATRTVNVIVPDDWTFGNQLTSIVNITSGVDAAGNPSNFLLKAESDKSTTFYSSSDLTDFAEFKERKKAATAIDGIGRTAIFGGPGVVALGTSTGRLYEIPVAADSEPGVPSLLFADPEGEPINVIHHGKIAGEWVFADEGGKIKTIPVGGGVSPTERLDLNAVVSPGAEVVDLATGPYMTAVISRKDDFTFDLKIVSADWSVIKSGGDIAPVLSDINPVELNYNYNIGMWVASGADGTVVTTADINNWLV
jgi:hypothetical protein